MEKTFVDILFPSSILYYPYIISSREFFLNINITKIVILSNLLYIQAYILKILDVYIT